MKHLPASDEKKLIYYILISLSWKLAVLLIWLVVIWSAPSSAKADSFWEEQAVGWHWYQDPIDDKPVSNSTPSITDSIAVMDNLQHQVKQTLDQAILNPTEDNVRNYIILQNQLGDRAQRFSEVWRTVLLDFPELDFSLEHPTNNLAKQIYLNKNHQAEDAAIHQFAEHNSLFFFYRSTCPYCQRFAPIVKDFSKRYHLTVIPITTDGVSLPDFPDSRLDQGQAARLKVTVEPALFTVDPKTHRIIPVSYGLPSEDELRQRLLEIARYPATSETSHEKTMD